MSILDNLKEHLDTLIHFLENTKTISGYNVEQDLRLDITKQGVCMFIANGPCNVLTNELGEQEWVAVSKYITTPRP